MARSKNTGEMSASLLAGIKSINEESLQMQKTSTNLLGNISGAVKQSSLELMESKKLLQNASWNLDAIAKSNLAIAESIDKLRAELGGTVSTGKSSDSVKNEIESLGNMSNALSQLIKVADKASPKAGKTIEKTLTSISKAIENVDTEKILEASEGIYMMGLGIKQLGFALALATPLYIIGAPGALLAGATIWALSKVMSTIDGEQLAEASEAVGLMGMSILILGGSIALFGLMVNPMAVLGVAGSVLLLGTTFALVGLVDKQITKGAFAMGMVGLSVGILSLGLLAFKATGVNIMDALTVAGTTVIVGGAMALAGIVAGQILMGSLAMSAASIPLFLLGMGMSVFKSAEVTMEDVGILGLTIVTVGGAAALAGAFAPLIILGSGALLAAGLALNVLTYGLKSFKSIGWNEEDSKSLTYAFGSLRVAFLGGEGGSKNILSAIGGFFTGILDSARLIANASAYLIAGGALIAISTGLQQFKKVSWSKEDSESLTSVFVSLTKSFSLLSDKKMQKEYGINTSPAQLFKGILAMSMAGNTITNLAKGVQSFANLTFPEYTFNESTGKLELTGKTTLSSSDIETAGNNIAHVISVVGSAFADVGRLNDGGQSSNSILSAIWGGGKRYVYHGVNALRGAGRTVVNLARGVKEFASLSFTEYEIKDGELVPARVHKMSSGDIEMAGMNIAKVISIVGSAFAEVGKLNEGGQSNNSLLSAIYGGGGRYVKTGVAALRTSGKTIVSLAQGVKDFANMNIVEYGIQEVDGVSTLVPVSVRPITDNDLQMAGMNISRIISVVGSAFAEVGRLNAGEGSNNTILSSIFGTGMVESGVRALSGVGDNLNSIAEAVPKYASLSFVKMGIQNIDGKPTLVPQEIIQLSEADLETAGINISKVLSVVAKAFSEVGKMAAEGRGWWSKGYLEKGVKALSGVGDNLHGIVDSTLKVASMQMPIYDAEGNVTGYTQISEKDLLKAGDVIKKLLGTSAQTFAEFGKEYGEGSDKNEALTSGLSVVSKVSSEYAKMVEALTKNSENAEQTAQGVETIGQSMTGLIKNVFAAFNLEEDPLLGEKMNMLERFTLGISTLSKSANGLSQTADSIERIGNSMQVFKDNINAMDVTNLRLVDSLFNSFAALSNIGGGIESMSEQIKISIEDSMKKLADLLNEMNGTTTQQLNTNNAMLKVMETGPQPVSGTPSTNEINKMEQRSMSTMNARALEEIENRLSSILDEIRRGINNFNR